MISHSFRITKPIRTRHEDLHYTSGTVGTTQYSITLNFTRKVKRRPAFPNQVLIGYKEACIVQEVSQMGYQTNLTASSNSKRKEQSGQVIRFVLGQTRRQGPTSHDQKFPRRADQLQHYNEELAGCTD